MTLEDWHQAQEVDPVLSLVIARLRDGMLGKSQSQTTDPQSQSVPVGAQSFAAQKGCPIQMSLAQRIRGDPPSVGFASCTKGGCSQRMP